MLSSSMMNTCSSNKYPMYRIHFTVDNAVKGMAMLMNPLHDELISVVAGLSAHDSHTSCLGRTTIQRIEIELQDDDNNKKM